MKIAIQTDDFDVGAELAGLRSTCGADAGAIVNFVGSVREMGFDAKIDHMQLEHYPGMTEKSLQRIADQACKRWGICDLVIIHRIGRLPVNAQIVLVAVASQHRANAFSACEFIVDHLKTEAPFWKKEVGVDQSQWVAARTVDVIARSRWYLDSPLH